MSLQIVNIFMCGEIQIETDNEMVSCEMKSFASIDGKSPVSNLNSYEDMGQELKQRDLDQSFDPDYHKALAATLGLQDH